MSNLDRSYCLSVVFQTIMSLIPMGSPQKSAPSQLQVPMPIRTTAQITGHRCMLLWNRIVRRWFLCCCKLLLIPTFRGQRTAGPPCISRLGAVTWKLHLANVEVCWMCVGCFQDVTSKMWSEKPSKRLGFGSSTTVLSSHPGMHRFFHPGWSNSVPPWCTTDSTSDHVRPRRVAWWPLGETKTSPASLKAAGTRPHGIWQPSIVTKQ